jgi:hypothetical protein
MKDVDYVRAVLSTDFKTEHPHEIPYPDLDNVIGATSFEYLEGTIEGKGRTVARAVKATNICGSIMAASRYSHIATLLQ